MRVKTGPHRRRRHNKVLSRTKGMRLSKGTLYRASKEADLHAGQYAYVGRRLRKRDLRTLWIQRINACLSDYKSQELSYSKFINLLEKNKISLNRKVLADLAVNDPDSFRAIINKLGFKK